MAATDREVILLLKTTKSLLNRECQHYDIVVKKWHIRFTAFLWDKQHPSGLKEIKYNYWMRIMPLLQPILKRRKNKNLFFVTLKNNPGVVSNCAGVNFN